MARSQPRPEQLILTVLHETDVITLDRLVAQLPELTWNQVFQAVDALSRRGVILLRRRGYQYEARVGPRATCRCS